MELKNISNEGLLALAKEKSGHERSVTLEVINIIREVETRRLYLELGFGSLFEFVTKELGYDESAANRRITAARLIRQLPEIEDKVSKGNLTLSNLVQAQVFFRKEEKLRDERLTPEKKREVLLQLEDMSSREAERTLLKISPEQIVLKESERAVTENHTELKVIIDQELKAKFEKIRSLLSHKNSKMTQAELLNEIADIALRQLDPRRGKMKHKLVSPPASAVDNCGHPARDSRSPMEEREKEQNGRYIPATVRREIWQRDQGKCTFVSEQTGRKCNSTYKLEIHHEHPFALGGETTPENLKLVCRRHNSFFAIRDFGAKKMSAYIKALDV